MGQIKVLSSGDIVIKEVMPGAAMAVQRKPFKNKQQLKALLAKELNFMKNIFSIINLPIQVKDSEINMDFEMTIDNTNNDEKKEIVHRARSIAELEEKLEKMKSQNNFNLKNKLFKKSLTSKLNKKLKKEKLKDDKTRMKTKDSSLVYSHIEDSQTEEKPADTKSAKPIFNNDAKLVFSKFDFSNVGRVDKVPKSARDPKKSLENLKQQEQKLQELENKQEINKVKEIKEKLAWKNILQKAEGQKVKDDPTLLKKTIKKMEQKKKHSRKEWDTRVQNVTQKKEARQKKRTQNIYKKKKEKQTKKVKAAVKRGRVVI